MNPNLLQKIKMAAPYTPGEQPKTQDIIKLNTNEHPYPPSPKVVEAYKNLDISSLPRYPDSECIGLNQAIADYYNLEIDQVFSGNGSDEVLALAFLTFFQSDLPVLFPDITYSFYKVWCELYDIKYKLLPLDDRFRIHPGDYAQPNGGIVIANPNAPTSIALGLSQIEEIIKANGESVVIVDEAYIDFGGDSVVELINRYENLLVVHTFSKFRGMAGLRVGYAMGNRELIGYLNNVKNSFNSYPLDTIQQNLATAALSDRDYYVDYAKKIGQTRDSFITELSKLGFDTLDSRANFVFTTHQSLEAKDIFEYLRGKNIFVRYFNADRISNYLRITIGTEREMERLISALEIFIVS